MGLFDSLFGGDDPSDYLDQASDLVKNNYGQYAQQGQNAYNNLNPAYSSMSSNPAAYLENIMKNYQPSAAYNLQKDEALKAAGNSAAAGGMRGSLTDIQNSSRLTDSLMGQDMQQWLNNVLGIQNTGLQGQQNFYNTGYNATNAMTGDLSNILGTKAQLAQQQQSGMMSLLGTLGGAGIGALAGPLGSALGAKVGASLLGGGQSQAPSSAPSWLHL